MVYYFTSNVVSPSAFIYVGKDKVESLSKLPIRRIRTVSTNANDHFPDEELIRYGLEEDVW